MLDDILNKVNILKIFYAYENDIKLIHLRWFIWCWEHIYAVNKLFVLETVTVSFGDQGLLSCLAIFIIIQFDLFCYIFIVIQ